MTDTHRRTAMAERAARAGGAVARDAFRDEPDVETKTSKTDLVTRADRDAQRQVVATLVDEFPNDAIVAEEDAVPPARPGEAVERDGSPQFADSVPDTGDAWVIDPIDGTANFVRGLRLWTTSVAAVVDGEPVGAATYLPAARESYTAGTDSATRDGEALSVSERTDPETFAVAGLGRYGPETADEYGALARRSMETLGDLRRLGSMQATLALVAGGGLDAAFAQHHPHPWDTIAGVHLVRQAGGVVTDLDGERWRPGNESLVASNGQAHDVVRGVAQGDADVDS